MAFVRRRIEVTFLLGTGSFGETGDNQVTVGGLRTSVAIQNAGTPSMGMLQLRVWGLPPSILNQLTALTPGAMIQRQNSVTVVAGDEGSILATVFQGTISTAFADLNGQPDSVLNVTAFAGQFQKIKLAAPSSYPGTADAAVIMQNIAAAMEVPFVNAGVIGAQLSTQYLPGTTWQQAQRCADAAGIMWNSLDDGTLTIWPRGASRTASVPLISPATGMIDYPRYTGNGIAVSTLFNPAIRFGAAFRVDSSITQARGAWIASNVIHDLESEMPGGNWKTDIEGFSNYDAPIPTN